MTQKDVNFKVKTLLEELESDIKANSEDPELMQHAAWQHGKMTQHGKEVSRLSRHHFGGISFAFHVFHPPF